MNVVQEEALKKAKNRYMRSILPVGGCPCGCDDHDTCGICGERITVADIIDDDGDHESCAIRVLRSNE
jgi:hypothetical protein